MLAALLHFSQSTIQSSVVTNKFCVRNWHKSILNRLTSIKTWWKHLLILTWSVLYGEFNPQNDQVGIYILAPILRKIYYFNIKR
jgi:hypothetical protein